MYTLVSIVVLTWNGKPLLKENLPSIIEAASFHHKDNEIIVVDNGSSDETAEMITRSFPKIRLIRLETNCSVGYAFNIGIKACRHSIVIILANDVRVTHNFLSPLVRHFSDPNIFAVNTLSLGEDAEREKKPVSLSFLPYPGHAAYSKKKLELLGGFHPLYAPFYFEDRDLSHRAWKRGWPTLVEPESIIFHKGEATIKKMHRPSVEKIKFRNRLFFFLTCHDKATTMIFPIGAAILQAILSFRWYLLSSLVTVVARRKEIIAKREEDIPFWIFSDRKIARIIETKQPEERRERFDGTRVSNVHFEP